MRNRWFLAILAIVVIPVSITCMKIVEYTRESREQIYDLHHHIANALFDHLSLPVSGRIVARMMERHASNLLEGPKK